MQADGAAPLEIDARQLVAVLDLTRLSDHDRDADVQRFCRQAANSLGSPAALCVHRRFLPVAAEALRLDGLHGRVRLATVANFPGGTGSAGEVADEVAAAVAAGADEVDVVAPWRNWLDGRRDDAGVLAAAREASEGRTLKVILETGMLGERSIVLDAARRAVAAGADFLKTSTGKAAVGATPEAVATMLEVAAEAPRPIGIKVSGGISTVAEARRYASMVVEGLGLEALDPARLRIGASSLLDALLDEA
ncbi:MAG: deoxyribose-phosphate aldolase [Wenzhouxiangellaceae bacterium]|nr:deoxyribose-phosphate aldolase [Wenzhouxiangellaceae bacterium]